MPTATWPTLHILASVAEHELISKRTKAALIEAKRSGTKLGNPRIKQARVLAQAAFQIKRPAPEVMALMRGWPQQQWILRHIADELDRLQHLPRARAAMVQSQLCR